MKRRMLTALGVALVLAACGGSNTVATVDGNAISADELEGMRTAYAEADVLDGAALRDDLNLLIIAEALTGAVADMGFIITDADVQDRIDNPPVRWAQNIAGIDAAPELGDTRLRTEARLTLIRDFVIGAVVLDEYGTLEAYVEAFPQDVVQICGRHILTATPEQAAALLDRLEAGEDFETLAGEASLAPSPLLVPLDRCPTGVGALGAEFAQAVVEAEIGVPIGPVPTDFGFHIVVVDQREVPTDEAAFRADATEFLDPGAAGFIFTNWFNGAVRGADIEVASNIGRWSPDGLGIAEPGA